MPLRLARCILHQLNSSVASSLGPCIVNRSISRARLSTSPYLCDQPPALPLNGMASRDAKMPQAERLFEGLVDKADVWSIFTPANMPPDAVNLGQGFMNWPPPKWLLEAAHDAMSNDVMTNHYAHPRGRPRLLNALSKHYSPTFEHLAREGRQLQTTEIAITAGANGGLYAAMCAFVRPGEEVIFLEPFFDQYYATTIFQGAKNVFVPLHPPKKDGGVWTLDLQELEAAITPKTRALIVNTPQNPTGKVFTRQELEGIAEICIRRDIMVFADEPYDCMLYDGREHFRIASLPGMWERTITIGSGGKSFAATGWRVGWLFGEAEVIAACVAAHSRLVFCTNSPFQETLAIGLEQAKERHFFEDQLAAYTERRDVICSYFDKLGLPYTAPEGTYFLLVDMSKVQMPDNVDIPDSCRIGRGKDFARCWWMAWEIGVVTIPPSEFYSQEHKHIGEKFARVAFCKDVPLLHKAGERLMGLKEYIVDRPIANGVKRPLDSA